MAGNNKAGTYWLGPGNVRIAGGIFKPGAAIPTKDISKEKLEGWKKAGNIGDAPFTREDTGEALTENQALKAQVLELGGNLVTANTTIKDLRKAGAGRDPEDLAKIINLEKQVSDAGKELTAEKAKVSDLEKQVSDLTDPPKGGK